MSYNISIVQRANKHLIKAIDWCMSETPGFEKKFLKSIDFAIKDIKKNPLKYQVRYDDVRIKFLKISKFGVHYIIKKKHIFIVGIFHTSQDSEKWLE